MQWAKVDGDVVTVGITDHAQAELGDVVYVELPEVGSTVSQKATFGVVESVKVCMALAISSSSDFHKPISRRDIQLETINAVTSNERSTRRRSRGSSPLLSVPHSNRDEQAASDVYSPVSGEVVSVNEELSDSPVGSRRSK